MKKKRYNYSIIADLFRFPDAAYTGVVKSVQQYFDINYPEIADKLRTFSDTMSSLSMLVQQEIYIRSFVVQAITTIDVGYIVFGDDYKRGELLVNLNREHAKYNIDCGVELADHLPNVLRLIDVLEDELLLRDLMNRLIFPALRKIIGEFGENAIAAKDKVYLKHHKTLLNKHESFSIYKHPLMVLFMMLENDFEMIDYSYTEKSGGFLSSIKQEINLES